MVSDYATIDIFHCSKDGLIDKLLFLWRLMALAGKQAKQKQQERT